MDSRHKLNDVLNEISGEVISERGLTVLKLYSKDNSMWLTSANADQLFLICETFQKIITASSRNSLQIMIVVLDTYAKNKTGNPLLLLKHCLPSICQFLETALNNIGPNTKEREKSALLKILSSLANLELPLKLFARNLLKLLFSYIFNEIGDLGEYCLMLLLSFPTEDAVSTFYIETMFETIQGRNERYKKTFTVIDKKLPMPFLFLIAYTQGLLGENSDDAYEKAFKFTAHLVDSLCNKCCDKQHEKSFMAFAEDYLGTLIAIGTEPDWPVVPFILQLVTKAFFCNLIQPNANPRLQSFLIKQIPRIAERLKGCESKHEDVSVPELKTKIVSYIELIPRDYIKGDIMQAYRNLWSKYFPGGVCDDDDRQPSTKADAELAGIVLEQLRDGKASSMDCLKLLLKCSSNPNKTVKTNAVKALAKIILMEPSYLGIPKVQSVLGECLESLSASGRVSIGNMLGTYLSTNPALTEKFTHYFMTLLKDDAFTVRRTAINAVAGICAVDYFHGMELLATTIMLQFYDPELAIHNAVVDFFKTVFVNRVNHLGCLVEINVNASIRKTMVPFFQKLEDCTGKGDLIDGLSLLAEAVVLYLKTNSEEKKKLAAGVVLESLALVYPSCLVNQFSDIYKLAFLDAKEPYLKKKLCHTLISSSAFIKDEEKAAVFKHVKKTILENFDWEKLGPCVLELLMVLSKFATENIFDNFLKPSLEMLVHGQNDEPRRDIFLPLSIVSFLWKDYEKFSTVEDLLMKYLQKPSYQLTVLSGLTEARLETASEKVNPVLNRLIVGFISNTRNPVMAIAGLKYLSHCLLGDEKNYEKPEMKQLGDSTTASLSQLLQETLQPVLACTFQPHLGIRRSACGVIRQIVQSGLLLRSHFIAYLVAMTSDSCGEIRNTAFETLKAMPEMDVSLFVIKGVAFSYRLRKILHPDSIVRGRVEPGNAVCDKTFELIQTAARVRRLLGNLVAEAAKMTTGIEETVFLLDHIVFYPYKALTEVTHVVSLLRKEIFKARKTCQSRLLMKAKECLDKTYKLSVIRDKWDKEKIQRVAVKEYLDDDFCAEWHQNGEDAAQVLLMCVEELTDSEAEPDLQPEEDIDDDELNEIPKKRRHTKCQSGGSKRTKPQKRQTKKCSSI